MIWCVEYWDDQQARWNVGLVTELESASRELADWLNGLGWQARVTRQVEVENVQAGGSAAPRYATPVHCEARSSTKRRGGCAEQRALVDASHAC